MQYKLFGKLPKYRVRIRLKSKRNRLYSIVQVNPDGKTLPMVKSICTTGKWTPRMKLRGLSWEEAVHACGVVNALREKYPTYVERPAPRGAVLSLD